MATQVDLSGMAYFLPLLSYLIVGLIVFLFIQKGKIFEDKKWLQIFLAFLVATVFVSFLGARDYVIDIIPWVAVLVVCLFFIVMVIGFFGDKTQSLQKPVGIIFMILMILGFLISAIFVFSAQIGPYLPGSSHGGSADPQVSQFTNWLYTPRVGGAILLLIVSGLVAWALVGTK